MFSRSSSDLSTNRRCLLASIEKIFSIRSIKSWANFDCSRRLDDLAHAADGFWPQHHGESARTHCYCINDEITEPRMTAGDEQLRNFDGTGE